MDLKSIEVVTIGGKKTTFGELAKPVTLVVNVASRCGLTPQYEALENLQKKYSSKGFTVVGFPSNQFLQELKENSAISEYCSTTWGVTFPMTEKVKVNGRGAHPLYKQLTSNPDAAGKTGMIKWNFEKFLILKDGSIHRFAPTTKPDDPEIVNLIESSLK